MCVFLFPIRPQFHFFSLENIYIIKANNNILDDKDEEKEEKSNLYARTRS